MIPRDLGLEEYGEWRAGQDTAFDFLTGKPSAWKTCALPTGVGKSLLAVTYAKWLKRPAVILTSTKALQSQYMKDFARHGLVEMRGMSNYPCRLWKDEGKDYDCSLGPCLDDKSCGYKTIGCGYFDQLSLARRSPIVVTNYAFWFTAARNPNRPLGDRPLVLCDEAHSAMEELSRFVGVEFSNDEVRLGDKQGWGLDEWREWAKEQLIKIKQAIPQAKTFFQLKTLKSMEQKVARLSVMPATGWCIDMFESKSVRFEPIWARDYVSQYLRQGAQETVLLSATIRPYHMDWFGVNDFSFYEVESPFPVERRPIHWIPTLRMSRATEGVGFPRLMKRIDDIIRSRPDRKGIIHTVSFSRARQIVEASEFKDRMDLNVSSNTSSVVDNFKRSNSDRILVSPSIDTGFDFPYRSADWQIIAKVPFPVPTDPLVAARSLDDDSYHAKVAVSRLVQMTGRVMRAEDDMGETFILDDNVNFLVSRYKPFFPRWWRDAYRRTGFVPPAPDVLASGGPSPKQTKEIQ